MHVISSSAVHAWQKRGPKEPVSVDCFYGMLPES